MLVPMFKAVFRFFRQAHKRERGQVFLFVALLLGVIGGMGAIAIDLGSYSAERRDLQNAADAIALAASQDLPDAGAANWTANSWQTKNKAGNATMTVTVRQQSLPDTPNPSVKITLTRSHNFSFARLIGITSTNVSANATAIRTSPGGVPGGGGGLMPWSVLEAVKNSASPGTTLVLKYDSNNVTNGNFGALRVDGNGASIYRGSIENGTTNGLCAVSVPSCTYASSSVQTQPGNMTGPTRTGTDDRISTTDTACDTWAEAVVDVGGKQLVKPECNPFTKGGNLNSKRIIVVPVILSLCDGACNVTVTEFALFFLEGYGSGGCTGNDCEIEGRFISSNTSLGAIAGIYDSDSTTAHFVRLVE